MEAEGIEANTYRTADPVGMGGKYIPVQCVGTTFCPYRLDQLWRKSLVFHFAAHLYTNSSFMIQVHKEKYSTYERQCI